MARIPYNPSSVGGEYVARAVSNLHQAQEYLERAKALADSVTGGGVTPAALEGSTEFGVAVSDGSAFYDAVANMKVNAATVTQSALADLDMGD